MRKLAIILPLVALLSGTALAHAQQPATSAGSVIGHAEGQTTLSGYGRWVIWSARDLTTGRYRLSLYQSGLGSKLLPVRSRAIPFDVDLGPGRNDHPTAVYARCSRDAEGDATFATSRFAWIDGTGCDIYEFDVITGRERRVAGASQASANEVQPSIWRGQIAFVRTLSYRKGRPSSALLPQLRVLSHGDNRSTALPVSGTSYDAIDGLDLYGSRLVYQADRQLARCQFRPEPKDPGTSREVWVVDLAHGAKRTRIEQHCDGERALSIRRPTLGPFGMTATTEPVPATTPPLAISRVTTTPPIRVTPVQPYAPQCAMPSSAQYDGGIVVARVDQDPGCAVSDQTPLAITALRPPV
jgi:hypothetical protein